MSNEPRFPNIDWYCDRCRRYLNSQPGFDDHKYIWKCTECGYKNSISAANIIRGQSFGERVMTQIFGFLRSANIWVLIYIMLCFIFGIESKINFQIKMGIMCIYPCLIILEQLFVRFILHYRKFSIINELKLVLGDITRPAAEVGKMVLCTICQIFPARRSGKEFLWHFSFGVVYGTIVLFILYLIKLDVIPIFFKII